MRIGRLRARLRKNTLYFVEPRYYRYCTSFKAFGEDLEALIRPFDGKAFLHWYWYWQNNKVWYGCSANGLIPAALIDYKAIWSEWIKETKVNEKSWHPLTTFYESYDDIIVNCTFSLEGEWIKASNTLHITVLKTTQVKMEFKAETLEVLLPPGSTVYLSPLTLMQKLGENISIKKNHDHLPPEVMKIFTSAKTPQELAARLELEPIRLREELVNKGEVMSRLADD